MKVGIIQSSYLPWRGFFDFIASVDVFVILDTVQYSKGSWRNRNKIKTPKGAEWVTVPVLHNSLSQRIIDTQIDYSKPWKKKQIGSWTANYGASPYFDTLMSLLEPLDVQHDTISQLNIHLITKICEFLEIKTPLISSTTVDGKGVKTDRLIDILRKLGATSYLSGPSADDYLDKDAFKKSGIGLEYKSYVYDPYPQLWGDFIGEVTVLDLIANCGPMSRNFLFSKVPNQIIIAGRKKLNLLKRPT